MDRFSDPNVFGKVLIDNLNQVSVIGYAPAMRLIGGEDSFQGSFYYAIEGEFMTLMARTTAVLAAMPQVLVPC